MRGYQKESSFTKWRNVLLGTTFLGYCLFYLTRKSCIYSVPLLLDDKSVSFTNEAFGVMTSIQMITYGIGKFICGVLSDNYSSKLMFSVGLLICGITNIIFAFSYSNWQFISLWAVNGLFQGCGWAPIAILIKRWYLPNEIGTIWSVLSATINISSSVIPILMVSLSSVFHWRISFHIIGVISVTYSLISFILVKDFPSELHVHSCEVSPGGKSHDEPQLVCDEDKDEISEEMNVAPEKRCESNGDITDGITNTLVRDEKTRTRYADIFSSRFLCLISIAYLLWTALREGIDDWLLVYLINEKLFSAYEGSFFMMCFHFGGITATLTSGFISDILMSKFKNKAWSSSRLPVMIFCATYMLLWLHLIQSSYINSSIFIQIICFKLGLCCYGPTTLFGLVVLENSPPGLSGTAHGVASTAATIGSVFAGYPLSYLSEYYGWTIVFFVLQLLAIGTSVMLIVVSRISCKIGNVKDD